MKLRDFLNNNSAIVTILALVILVGALGTIIWNVPGKSRRAVKFDIYYYDMGTGKIFTDTNNLLAPIDAPSGPYKGKQGGVQAFIYACGECASDYTGMTADQIEETGAIVAWLQMYTEEYRQAIQKARSGQGGTGSMPSPMMMGPGMGMFGGMLLKRPDDETWVSDNTEEAMGFRQVFQSLCPDGRPRMCRPK